MPQESNDYWTDPNDIPLVMREKPYNPTAGYDRETLTGQRCKECWTFKRRHPETGAVYCKFCQEVRPEWDTATR